MLLSILWVTLGTQQNMIRKIMNICKLLDITIDMYAIRLGNRQLNNAI